jgi:osmoprotectant transport system ATP-binding protein
MTVEENVGLVPRLEQWDAGRAGERVRALLDLVGLPPADYARRQPHELSGGQRQRVGVARALAVDPPILLMDEPFGALDPITRVELRREFTRIRSGIGTTVVLVTHDLAEAFAMATRIGVLDAGGLAICGPPDAVAASTDPRVRTFLETVWTGRPAEPAAAADAPRS